MTILYSYFSFNYASLNKNVTNKHKKKLFKELLKMTRCLFQFKNNDFIAKKNIFETYRIKTLFKKLDDKILSKLLNSFFITKACRKQCETI